MRKLLAALFVFSLAFVSRAALAADATATMETSMGTIVIALDRAHAPLSVDNFIRYAREGHFDGTIIYRVVPDFVLQMGSTEPNGHERPKHDPIRLESGNGLLNLRGTLSMARTSDPNSATAEFFINLSDNPDLDPKAGDDPGTTGYAVFGKVISGMDVVDRIATVPLDSHGAFENASPITAIVITKVSVSEVASY